MEFLHPGLLGNVIHNQIFELRGNSHGQSSWVHLIKFFKECNALNAFEVFLLRFNVSFIYNTSPSFIICHYELPIITKQCPDLFQEGVREDPIKCMEE